MGAAATVAPRLAPPLMVAGGIKTGVAGISREFLEFIQLGEDADGSEAAGDRRVSNHAPAGDRGRAHRPSLEGAAFAAARGGRCQLSASLDERDGAGRCRSEPKPNPVRGSGSRAGVFGRSGSGRWACCCWARGGFGKAWALRGG